MCPAPVTGLFLSLLFLFGPLFPLRGLDQKVIPLGEKLFYGMNTKVLENGVPIDFSLGYRYTPSIEGELRFRRLKESYNDRLYADIEESLSAADEQTIELFVLPFRYHFFNTGRFKFNLAGGGYYEYNKLHQTGFFNMPALGAEAVNTYLNDFSMHILGPLFETGLKFRLGPAMNLGKIRFDSIADLKLNAGAVPIFYLRRNQAMKIDPYMGHDFFEYTQETRGSPYVFGEIEGTLFTYISLAFLYEFAKIDYNVITFDANRNWGTMGQEVIARTFKIEVLLFLPTAARTGEDGNPGLKAVLGYGRSYEAIELDSSTPVRREGQYFIFGGKKEFF